MALVGRGHHWTVHVEQIRFKRQPGFVPGLNSWRMSMRSLVDPIEAMSAAERLAEVSEILAGGFVRRLRMRAAAVADQREFSNRFPLELPGDSRLTVSDARKEAHVWN
jgi:hypothetical protein